MRDKWQFVQGRKMASRLNIVLLEAGRMRLTSQALVSLATNTRTPYCLTVVKDGESLGGTIAGSRDPHNEQVLDNPKPGCTGAARNAGIEAARERFGTDGLLYLSDNDVYFQPGWDKALLAAWQMGYDFGFRIIGGGCHPYHLFNKRASYKYVSNGQLYEVQSREAISGYSWLLDWQTFDKYGPLDAFALGVRQSEDWTMCRKVVEDKFYVGSVVPEVVVHTGLTDSFGQRPPGWELMAQRIPEGVIAE